MSYEKEDESTENREVNEKIDELREIIYEDVIKVGEENDSVALYDPQGKFRSGGASGAFRAKKTDFGTITEDLVIDFIDFDDRNIVGDINGSPIAITFLNSNTNIRLHMKIYLRSTNPTLTIGGQVIDNGTKPWVIDDFLDIDLRFDFPPTAVIEVVKKNNDLGGGDIVPGIPLDVLSTDERKNSIKIIWQPPLTGTLKVLYDLAWSTSPAGNSTDGPDTNAPGSPITGIDALEQTASGLNTSTTYFFWVRGTNAAGNGIYFGPLQTVTEPSNTPGDVNFSISATSFNTVQASWVQPVGKQLQFTLTRDPGGNSERLLASRVTTSEIIIDDRLEPLTLFPYRFEVFNEVGSLLSIINVNVTTPDLPLPVVTITVIGRTLQFSVPIPIGINICDINWSTLDTFVAFQDRQLVKTVSKSLPQTVIFQTPDLNQNTEYFVRARFELNAHDGQFNATQSATTGILPTPQRPQIDTFTSNLTRGIVKFEIDFQDNESVNERADISFRDAGSVGEFFPFGGNALDRDSPPADDLDPNDENQILVVRAGGGWGAVATITVVGGAIIAFTISNGGQSFVSGSAISVYDDNDNNNNGFEGTAIVNGIGQLTGVNITSGGDFWDNGATVEILGQIASGDPGFGVWVPGNQITLRAVCTNLTGTSEADTINVTPATS